jgi:hypothetical protein
VVFFHLSRAPSRVSIHLAQVCQAWFGAIEVLPFEQESSGNSESPDSSFISI